jgi:capsular exopolysaccharide synthesis family protein
MEKNDPVTLPAKTGVIGAQNKARYSWRQSAGIERSYSEIWRRLWATKWTLLNVTLAGAVLALMMAAIETPLYRLHSSLEVQEMNEKFTDYNPGDSQDGGERTLSDVQTQIRMLMSRSLVERTVTKMPESARVRVLDVPRPFWKKASFDRSIESIVSRIEAHPSKQARIIDVTFMCQDSAAGALFLNALAQELADYNLERRWKTSQRTQAWLERELDDFRQKLEQSEREAEEYARVSGFALNAQKSNADQAKLLRLQSQLTSVQADGKTQPPAAAPVSPNLSSDPQLKALRARLATMAKQEADMEAIYSPQNQSVISMKDEIASVQAAYDKRKAQLLAQSRQAALETRKQVLEEDYKQQSQVVGDDAGRLAHYNTLQREVEANQKLFDTMTARMKEASVASALQASNILVVDPAYPASSVASPNPWMNGLLGSLAGFSIALIYSFIRNQIARTFAGPATVSHYLEIPLLGTIPTDRYSPQFTTAAVAHGSEQAPSLHLAFDQGLQTAESYRSLRSSILNALGQRDVPWRLLFISAGAGDGKTSVISNLGAALAGAQRKVLLVDADLRHPTLHEVFGMENEIGLIEFLGKQLPASTADTRQLIRATQIPGLYLMSAGHPGVNAPEILASDHLSLLLRDLVKGFDLVLLDSPPVLPYSDARSLAREADAVILVVRAHVTEIQAAIRARDTLAQDGADILGTILTDWNADADTLRFQAGYQSAN